MVRKGGRPVGWRNDSYRHYLAAKGVRTGSRVRRYMKPQEVVITEKKPFMENFTEAGIRGQSEKDFIEAVINRKQQEFQQKVMDATDKDNAEKGSVDSIRMKRFWEDFEQLKRWYRQDGDKERFERDADELWKHEQRANATNLQLFDDEVYK